MMFLGFDTSNYTTSAAAYNATGGGVFSVKRLLDVTKGERGLRQSDALFDHVSRLPTLVDELVKQLPSRDFSAVCASTRPRDVEGSYMPCFLAGEGHARVMSTILGVPFYAVSHQQNHVAAAAFSADRLDLLNTPHLAFHVSGGTTELLLVEPGDDGLPYCTAVSGTTDLAAGQIVDRCGQALGLGFPSGVELEALAAQATAQQPFLPKQTDDGFSLSGLENKYSKMIDDRQPPEVVARFVLDSIAAVLIRAAETVCAKHPDLPLLCAGGVMGNKLIRTAFEGRFDRVHFAMPQFSSDNAAGCAILAARMFIRGIGQ